MISTASNTITLQTTLHQLIETGDSFYCSDVLSNSASFYLEQLWTGDLEILNPKLVSSISKNSLAICQVTGSTTLQTIAGLQTYTLDVWFIEGTPPTQATPVTLAWIQFDDIEAEDLAEVFSKTNIASPEVTNVFSSESSDSLPFTISLVGKEAVLSLCPVQWKTMAEPAYPANWASVYPYKALSSGWNMQLNATLSATCTENIMSLGQTIPMNWKLPCSFTTDAFRMWLVLHCEWTYTTQLTSGHKATLDEIDLRFDLNQWPPPFPQIEALGSIESTAKGGSSLQLEALLDINNKLLVLQQESVLDFNLNDLLNITGLKALDQVPGLSTVAAQGLQLAQTTLQISWGSSLSLDSIALTIGTANLELIPDLMEIQPALQINIQNPFHSKTRTESFVLLGSWTIGTTAFHTMIWPATGDYVAGMAVGHSFDVDSVIQHLLPSDKSVLNLPEIDILDMEFTGNYKNSDYEIRFDVTTNWEFDILGAKIELQEVMMDVQKTTTPAVKAGGTASVNWNMQLEGAMLIGNFIFKIKATYQTGGDWSISASFDELNIYHADTMFTGVAQQFGLTHNLPETFAGSGIQQMQFSYDSSNHSFYGGVTFSVQPDFTIDGFPWHFTFQLMFERPPLAPPNKAQLSIVVMGQATIANEIFNLTITEQGGNFNLNASFTAAKGSGLPIGTLLSELATQLGIDGTPPSLLSSLELTSVYITYDTQSKDYTFACATSFDSAALDLSIQLNHTNGKYTRTFKGALTYSGIVFDVLFTDTATSNLLVGSFENKDGTSTKLKPIATAISSDLGSEVPANMAITLENAMMTRISGNALQKGGSEGSGKAAPKTLFAANISHGINLTNFPIVGAQFPPNKTVQLNIQPVFASQAFSQQEIQSIQQAQPNSHFTFPAQDITEGFTMASSIAAGGQPVELLLPIKHNASGVPVQSGTYTTPTATQPMANPYSAGGLQQSTEGKIKWYNVQKSFGPIHLQKIGLSYQNSDLWFDMDASLEGGGLSLSLIGLGIGSPITKFSPTFDLEGIGLSYEKGDMDISGYFSKVPVAGGSKSPSTEYDGLALIRSTGLSLSAIGSYCNYENQPSLFLYAVLDKSLGGPSFFYVTGLAAGFGYNRGLVSPTITQVATFPLVLDATNNAAQPTDQNGLMLVMQGLHTWIPPQIGEEFFAIGIKFNSFKMIDSFALLTVKFGQSFEIDLLGLSTMIIPTQEESDGLISPLAEVQMALKASYVPAEGFVGVQAQLTANSFILSTNCHLTGGFAFYSWFSGPHEGDFVVTVGGYHPQFAVPSYYPLVPRLGFSWIIDRNTSLSGGLYFALTPHALMAGGSLSLVYDDGSFRAWFDAGADFIISWKPYYYETDIYIDIGASYTLSLWFVHHTFHVSLGAYLSVWGPDFSGVATIEICGVSLSVNFGSSRPSPLPISWTQFQKSFLPASNDDIVTLNAKEGLQKEIDTSDNGTTTKTWILDPDHFVIVTNSSIPLKGGNKVITMKSNSPLAKGKDFGVGPMGVTNSTGITSEQNITIKLNGTTYVTDDFNCQPITKNMPTGMWGSKLTPGVNDPTFVKGALSGYSITSALKTAKGAPITVEKANLAFDTELGPTFTWTTNDAYTNQNEPDTNRRKAVKNGLGSNATRDNILTALGFDPTTSVVIHDAARTSNAFLNAPKIFELPTNKAQP